MICLNLFYMYQNRLIYHRWTVEGRGGTREELYPRGEKGLLDSLNAYAFLSLCDPPYLCRCASCEAYCWIDVRPIIVLHTAKTYKQTITVASFDFGIKYSLCIIVHYVRYRDL